MTFLRPAQGPWAGSVAARGFAPRTWMVLAAVALAGCGQGEDSAAARAGAADATPHAGGGDAAAYLACERGAATEGRGLSTVGQRGVLGATIVLASPAQAAKYVNEWTLDVTRADGSADEATEITHVQTFMPVHGHDGTPAPTASPGDGPSRFQLRFSFTMRGPWEVRVDARSPAGADHLVFAVCVVE